MIVADEQIMRAIVDLTDAAGYAPAMREVGAEVGLLSSGSIHARLARLARDGLIDYKPETPRTLRLTPQGEEWLRTKA